MSEELENVVTLTNSKGENIDFIECAAVSLPHGFYSILKPLNKIEGIGEDEAIVFKVIVDPKENTHSYELIIDEEILQEVFDEYNKLCDEEEK